jgi:hypothetical protein
VNKINKIIRLILQLSYNDKLEFVKKTKKVERNNYIAKHLFLIKKKAEK